MKAAILVLSDKGYRHEREDLSGPALATWLGVHAVEVCRTEIVPDETERIAECLRSWADSGQFDLIVTTGGTGVSPRDVTPEATLSVADRVLPGFSEAMRMSSFQRIPAAIISRAVTCVRKQTLIINLPGSPNGAIENLEVVWSAVAHTVKKLQGDPRDCVPIRKNNGTT